MYKAEWIKDLDIRELIQLRSALKLCISYGVGDEALADEIDLELTSREVKQKGVSYDYERIRGYL